MTGTRALTIYQPWATMIALGVKTIETRGYKCPDAAIGQRLLIHAGARKPDLGRFPPDKTSWSVRRGFHEDGGLWLWEERRLGPDRQQMLDTREDPWCVPLPLGAVVGSAVLAACVPMVDWATHTHPREHMLVEPNMALAYWNPKCRISVEAQRPYGDFAPGRWAWILENVKPTTERCPACWGDGERPGQEYPIGCRTCDGFGKCDPIPATGRQRIWYWEPPTADTAYQPESGT